MQLAPPIRYEQNITAEPLQSEKLVNLDYPLTNFAVRSVTKVVAEDSWHFDASFAVWRRQEESIGNSAALSRTIPGAMACWVLFPPIFWLSIDSCVFDWAKVIECDWKWLKMTESDWKWLRLAESDWNRAKLTKSPWEYGRNPLKVQKNKHFWDFALKVGAKQHLRHGSSWPQLFSWLFLSEMNKTHECS